MIDNDKLIEYLNKEITAAKYYEISEVEKALTYLLNQVLIGEFEEDE
jgi:hypothetical protein